MEDLNTLIMREMGLEIGTNGRIYDQDTCMPIQVDGASVIAPGTYGGRNCVEFNPNNRKLMGQLFGYFLDKYSDETGDEVIAFYSKNTPDGECLECKMRSNEVISSGTYKLDSLKYADLMMQMNGGERGQLTEYDQQLQNESIKRKN